MYLNSPSPLQLQIKRSLFKFAIVTNKSMVGDESKEGGDQKYSYT